MNHTCSPDRPAPGPICRCGATLYPPATEAVCRSPFGCWAQYFFDQGLIPIPCGGEGGKEPLLSTKAFQSGMSPQSLRGLILRSAFHMANIGILTGVGRVPVVVLDVDSDLEENAPIDAVASTPIVIRTPSGGAHFWFRWGKQKNANLRKHGLSMDIKAKGGLVIVPPSRRPDTGLPYWFLRGRLEDLPCLGPLDLSQIVKDFPTPLQPPDQAPVPRPGHVFYEGSRNEQTFRAGLRLACQALDEDAFTSSLQEWNRKHCAPPLPPEEVAKVARNVWHEFHLKGRNWAANGGVMAISPAHAKELANAPAVLLLMCLRRAHAYRQDSFALAFRAMAENDAVPGLGETALRNATTHLIKRSFIALCPPSKRTPRGGRLYRLTAKGRGLSGAQSEQAGLEAELSSFWEDGA